MTKLDHFHALPALWAKHPTIMVPNVFLVRVDSIPQGRVLLAWGVPQTPSSLQTQVIASRTLISS